MAPQVVKATVVDVQAAMDLAQELSNDRIAALELQLAEVTMRFTALQNEHFEDVLAKANLELQVTEAQAKVSALEIEVASATEMAKGELLNQDEVNNLKTSLAASEAKAASLQQLNTRLLQKVKESNGRIAELEDGVGNVENKNNGSSSSSSDVSVKKQTSKVKSAPKVVA